MGVCVCKETQKTSLLLQDSIQVQIEQDIRDDWCENEKVHKVLLLGTGNAGKSTIFKQLTVNISPKYRVLTNNLMFYFDCFY